MELLTDTAPNGPDAVSDGGTLVRADAAPGVHECVRALLASLPRGRMLDAPCGFGALSAVAAQMGFIVTASDIDPSRFGVPGLPCQRVDLNSPLPYKDGSFDVVACIEGIEHIENPFQLLREFARILTPKGRLVLTTPNVLSIPSRLRILATGLASYFDWDHSLREDGHIMPLSAPQLELALSRAGFDIVALTGNRTTSGAAALRPLAPAIRFLTSRSVTPKHLRDLLTDDVVLFSEILVLVAQKGRPRPDALPSNGESRA